MADLSLILAWIRYFVGHEKLFQTLDIFLPVVLVWIKFFYVPQRHLESVRSPML